MRINLSFRNWHELLIKDRIATGTPDCPTTSCVCQPSDLVEGEPVLRDATVWATYAIVSAEERRRLGCSARDMLIEQVQLAPIQTFAPATSPNPNIDIRFSHPVKLLMFGARNRTNPCEWSNYTTASPVCYDTCVDFSPPMAVMPVQEVSLLYEATTRLCMDASYYSLVQPYYFAPVCPTETGYMMYSFALDPVSCDPTGSTNFSKLSSISIVPRASQAAIEAASTAPKALDITSGAYCPQTFEWITIAVSLNIIRISGGALGLKFRKAETVGSCAGCDRTRAGKLWKRHTRALDSRACVM